VNISPSDRLRMAIPESQLETWSHQGSITQSSNTYNTIKSTLEASNAPYAAKKFGIFLQGSYGNDTNIFAESDVDVVIRLDESFYSDLSDLTDEEKAAHKAAFHAATYTHADFKRDVLSVLTSKYGASVSSGDKAISIDASGSRRKADVIVAAQFRRYSKFRSSSDSAYVEGICFWNRNGERIANYPKQHSANLTTKHQSTAKWLKPVVRIFKNMRSRMVDDLIEAGIAPSYFLEGLLYNVPSEKLAGTYQECVVNTLNWYKKAATKSSLVCANEQYYLLRDGSLVCWNQSDCDAFVDAAIGMWNEW
jgi:hypothetical protein